MVRLHPFVKKHIKLHLIFGSLILSEYTLGILTALSVLSLQSVWVMIAIAPITGFVCIFGTANGERGK